MLSPEIQAEILSRYFSKKQSIRCIARELGINRKSVAAVIKRKKVLLGLERAPRKSILDPYKAMIKELLEKDSKIPASTLLPKIREKGYSGGYTILKDWLVTHRTEFQNGKKEAFFELEFNSGECTQLDWGEFGNVFGDGVKIHCFAMVLCYSRLLYLEFTRSEKFESFIRCHEHAFNFFGGVTKELWHDNLTSAVTERKGSLVRFNARYWAYVGHNSIMPYACNKGKGNEKGRVENLVKLIRSSFWSGREFKDFDDLCRQARDWMTEIANRREHRATHKIPELMFEAEEKNYLQSLNPEPYDTDEIFSKEVLPQFHITYETNRYSVPWTMVGQVVTIRVDEQSLRFFYNDRQITYHTRSYGKHQKFTKPQHEEGLLELKPKGKSFSSWQTQAIKSIGPALERYLDFLKASPRSLRFELSKLLALSTIYGPDELNSVVDGFLKRGVIGTDKIELALKNRNNKSLKPEPLKFRNERLSRIPARIDLRSYDSLLFVNNHEEKPLKEEKKHETKNSKK